MAYRAQETVSSHTIADHSSCESERHCRLHMGICVRSFCSLAQFHRRTQSFLVLIGIPVSSTLTLSMFVTQRCVSVRCLRFLAIHAPHALKTDPRKTCTAFISQLHDRGCEHSGCHQGFCLSADESRQRVGQHDVRVTVPARRGQAYFRCNAELCQPILSAGTASVGGNFSSVNLRMTRMQRKRIHGVSRINWNSL